MSTQSIKQEAKSVLFTVLFCAVVALATSQVWPGPYSNHLLISFGYGASGIVCSRTLLKLFPEMNSRLLTLLSVVAAMTLGSLHAWFWLSRFNTNLTATDMTPILLLSLLFTIACYYYFHARSQAAEMEYLMEQAKRRQSEQERALVLSRLQQLQSQMEPHFLFNTLANIQVLIDLDSDKAKLMLQKLSELLRASLIPNRGPLTRCGEESQLLSAYLELQEIRLGRLSWEVICPDELTHQVIPPLLLQPLVENALTHGIEAASGPGHIRVTMTQNQDQLRLCVEDNGVGLGHSSNRGHGMGLSTLRERLQTLFGNEASLDVAERPEGGTLASLSLPLAPLSSLSQEPA
ncbi:histidine kinase [Ferrimonas sp. YFM]|uniref:sensor histidine kinase n=1 Tax=Ferrimonas sp. YFM TaxID=3028878 RepID=UPI002573F836|nr:histidine kinase [Ferrimonas sp. YFM]BDY04320.1 ATPase [Ferrimonas sp. YFM]